MRATERAGYRPRRSSRRLLGVVEPLDRAGEVLLAHAALELHRRRDLALVGREVAREDREALDLLVAGAAVVRRVDGLLDERAPRRSPKARRVAVEPVLGRPLAISTSSSVTSAATYGRRSPTTIACEMSGDVLSSFSRFCGATFLPPAVTRMSFLRSVIVTNPSSSIVADVAGAQPAVVAEHRARRLLVLEVAGEDGRAADQELAVVGEPQLDARHRRPDGAEAVAIRPVDRGGGRALRQPVALEDAGCRARRRTPRPRAPAARRRRSRRAAGRRGAP